MTQHRTAERMRLRLRRTCLETAAVTSRQGCSRVVRGTTLGTSSHTYTQATWTACCLWRGKGCSSCRCSTHRDAGSWVELQHLLHQLDPSGLQVGEDFVEVRRAPLRVLVPVAGSALGTQRHRLAQRVRHAAYQSRSLVTPGQMSSLGVPRTLKMCSSCCISESPGNRGCCGWTRVSAVSHARVQPGGSEGGTPCGPALRRCSPRSTCPREWSSGLRPAAPRERGTRA
jgi:hypothetical protein